MVNNTNMSTLNSLIRHLMDKTSNSPEQFGAILSIKNNILTISGLEDVCMGEILNCDEKTAMVVKLGIGHIKAISLGRNNWSMDDKLIRSFQQFSISVNNNMLGSVFDGFGKKCMPIEPIYANTNNEYREVFLKCKSVLNREQIDRQLPTGINMIDFMTPIGKGQKQLIVGQIGTGKTSLGLSSLFNFCKEKNSIGIYVSIGQAISSIIEIREKFINRGIENFIIVGAPKSSEAIERYLAPYIATAFAEHFQEQDMDTLIVFDEIGDMAKAYREMSVELGDLPGKATYPSDLFSKFAILLERGGNFSKGSITMVVIATIIEIGDYISTTIISITDGQIVLSDQLQNSGQGLAIDLGNSVSRIGNAVVDPRTKKLFGNMAINQVEYINQSKEICTDIQQHAAPLTKLVFDINQQKQHETYETWQQLLQLYYFNQCKAAPISKNMLLTNIGKYFKYKNRIIRHDMEIINRFLGECND